MTCEQAINYLYSRLKFGSVPGLERIAALCELLGNPQDKLKFVHVAGTNGKGSVCTMMSRMLINAGYKTGLYTSPYVMDFRERMQINGEMIPEDELGALMDEIKPKVFIYENVRAVTSHDRGKTWNKMQEVFKELGYSFTWTVLNAKNYGIPQNRERLFVVGIREDMLTDKVFEFPKSIPLEKKMKDFLMDNAPGGYFLPRKGVEFVTMEKNLTKKFTQIDGEVQLCQKKNQQFNWHGDFVFQSEEDAKANNIPDLEKYFLSEKVEKYVLATGTKNFYSKPKTDLDVARPLLTTMHKMHRAGVDNYVTTDGRLRKLTPRECLRLMGFSDNFKIVVSDTSMYQQAGNSIVVDVLIHIMEEILKCCPGIVEEV